MQLSLGRRYLSCQNALVVCVRDVLRRIAYIVELVDQGILPAKFRVMRHYWGRVNGASWGSSEAGTTTRIERDVLKRRRAEIETTLSYQRMNRGVAAAWLVICEAI